jgi:regulator of protease activity HflC (stomatin/prohibitin superfamily)
MNEQKTKNLFFSMLFFILIIVITIFFISDEKIQLAIIILISAIILIYLAFKFNIILQLSDYERALIFRFGKVNRVGGPGWTFVLPFIEKPIITTLRTQVIDIPPQQVITKDNIRLSIDAILYLSVENSKEGVTNSIVKVEDYKKASSLYVIAMLRDVLGDFLLTEVISNTERINKRLTEELKSVAKDWGIKISAVEIRDLKIPEEIIESMHKQKAAVQKKLAIYEEAESEKAKIVAINDATNNLSDKTVLYYYIKALEKIGEGQSSKIIFPLEVTNLLNKVSKKMSTEKTKINKTEMNQLEKYLPVVKNFLKKETMQKKTKKKK